MKWWRCDDVGFWCLFILIYLMSLISIAKFLLLRLDSFSIHYIQHQCIKFYLICVIWFPWKLSSWTVCILTSEPNYGVIYSSESNRLDPISKSKNYFFFFSFSNATTTFASSIEQYGNFNISFIVSNQSHLGLFLPCFKSIFIRKILTMLNDRLVIGFNSK